MFRNCLALLIAIAGMASAQTPSLFVVGDSTANNANRRGWGDPLADYFDPAKVKVLNKARGGRSSRTFVTEGLWAAVEAALKPGDYVLIEFGHNDGGPVDKDKFRGSLPGLGDESQEVTLADGSKQTVHTFGWYMRKMIAETKARGATPILLSPTIRNIWKDGKVETGLGHYGEWAAALAGEAGIAFLDHSKAIAEEYQIRGPEKVALFFPEDHTHTSPAGADLNAAFVVGALKGGGIAPVVAWLNAKGRAVEQYPPVQANGTKMEMPVPAKPELPSLFLIGDSTVRNGRGNGANGQWGWGDPIADHFDANKINVVNRAVGGLSSRTYLIQGHWDRVKGMLKPGDFVMMQFGHNDNGPLDDAARARGTIKGIGDESQEIDNPITKQHETVHTYGWYLRKFIDETRAAGATPIMCTLVPRKTWKDGKIVRNSNDYAKWAREVAAAAKVPVVDLNEMVARRYDALGEEKVEPLFGDEHTHTSRAGAELNAEVVVEGLQALQPNPLAAFIVTPKQKAVLEFDHAGDIYVVGDVHGDVERMVALLKAAKLSDGNAWTGGKATLVFTGDMIDKGPKMVETLRTIRALQIGAEVAGGRVIATRGNHEAEFLNDPSAEKFAAFGKELAAAGTSAAEVAKCGGDIGRFLCGLPIAVRVDDWFFSHGGNTNGSTIPQLNAAGFDAKILLDPNSILEARLGDAGPGGKPWITQGKAGEKQLLTDYVRALNAKHIVQGHQPKAVAFEDGVTRKPGEAFQRWGLLFLNDTGLSRDVDNSKGAILHISQIAKTATAVCANGRATVIWDAAEHAALGRAEPCN